MFSPVFYPIDRSITTSVALGNMEAVDSEPLPLAPVDVLLSRTKFNLGHCSQTEIAQGVSNRSKADIKRIEPPIMERDQLATSFNSANQRLSKLEQELNVMPVEKSALASNIDLHAAETKKLKGEKDSLVSAISEQDRANEPDKKRFKGADIYGGLHLRYVGVASKMLQNLSALCRRKIQNRRTLSV